MWTVDETPCSVSPELQTSSFNPCGGPKDQVPFQVFVSVPGRSTAVVWVSGIASFEGGGCRVRAGGTGRGWIDLYPGGMLRSWIAGACSTHGARQQFDVAFLYSCKGWSWQQDSLSG